MTDKKSLADALKLWRHKHSYSFTDASKVSGLPPTTLSNYERRMNIPKTVRSLQALSKILNINYDDIIDMASYDQNIRIQSEMNAKQKDQHMD